MNRRCWLKSLFFPKRCMLCRCFLPEDAGDLCPDCLAEAPRYPFSASNPPPSGKNHLHFLDSFTAIWYYEEDIRRAIHRYKFRRATHLAPKFGRQLADQLRDQGPWDYDLLTWVPVSAQRKRRRGYDQCQLLAEFVGAELGREPVRLLKKIRNTPAQSGISLPAERRANVLGAFCVCEEADIRGKRILLLDDVYTTGATAEECARVLLTAGAGEVHCAVIAAVRNRKK